MKNLKLLLTFLIFLFSIVISRAQVGIGNNDPQATLDITAANATGPTTNVDGILIPRVTRERAQSMTSTPTSTMIYINDVSTGTAAGTTINVTSVGFYFYNGSVWEKLGSGVSNDWSITGNTNVVDGNFIGTGASTDVDVAFKRNNAAAGKIGATSTSFGVGALTSGAATNSTAIGNNALSVSTGSANVAVGQNALKNSVTTASENTAVGVNALQSLNNAASRYNTAVGYQALANATGVFTNCVAVGREALINTKKEENTGIGGLAGSNISTGINNTAIGYNAQVPTATASNQIRIGDTRITNLTAQVNLAASSDKRLKSNIKNSELGLDFINKLRPVSYVRKNDVNKKTEYGFIAQELEETLNKAGDKNNGIISKDDAGIYAVRYSDFISITVKAVQEQQTQIEELQKENAELIKINSAILKRLEALEKKQKEKH